MVKQFSSTGMQKISNPLRQFNLYHHSPSLVQALTCSWPRFFTTAYVIIIRKQLEIYGIQI